MPIIEIRAVEPEGFSREIFLASVIETAAATYGLKTNHCWATFQMIDRSGLSEPGSPLVTIRAYAGRSLEEKAKLMSAVAATVGEGLGLPAEKVFVEYREIPEGHVFTGGKVL